MSGWRSFFLIVLPKRPAIIGKIALKKLPNISFRRGSWPFSFSVRQNQRLAGTAVDGLWASRPYRSRKRGKGRRHLQCRHSLSAPFARAFRKLSVLGGSGHGDAVLQGRSHAVLSDFGLALLFS